MEPTEKTQAETSKGVDTSKGATQENLPLKKQEGTFENLKSQYDKLQNQLTEKEKAWEQEKNDLLGKVNQSDSRLENIMKEIQGLKNPAPKEGQLSEPEPPSVEYLDDPVAWNNFYRKQREYDKKVFQKEISGVKEILGKTQGELQTERQLKQQAQEYEQVKAITKSRWMESNKMTAEEAEECWNWQTTVKNEDRIDAIGKMFKLTKNGGSNELKEELQKRKDLKMDGLNSGIGQGGGGETVDPSEFTKSADHKHLYRKKG